MPLVVEMPYTHLPERPFLESSLAIGWPTSIDHLERAAEKAGVVVAVIYGRGNVGDSPIGEADTFEALGDILGNYSIDTHRMYLFGTCEGGRRALLLAEHYPNVFAADGVCGPKLKADNERFNWNWHGSHGDVRTRVNGLVHTPTNIIEGEFDDVPPRAELESFFKVLRENSPSSEMHIYPGGGHSYSESEATQFLWFSQFRNELAKVPIATAGNDALAKVRR